MLFVFTIFGLCLVHHSISLYPAKETNHCWFLSLRLASLSLTFFRPLHVAENHMTLFFLKIRMVIELEEAMTGGETCSTKRRRRRYGRW